MLSALLRGLPVPNCQLLDPFDEKLLIDISQGAIGSSSFSPLCPTLHASGTPTHYMPSTYKAPGWHGKNVS